MSKKLPHDSPAEVTDVFRGPLDSSSLKEAVQDVLWCSIDLAQSKGGQLPSDDDVYWLNVTQVVEESK